MSSDDWKEVLFWAAILVLVVLFGGEPDLMDAIIDWLTNGELKQ